MIRNIPCCLRHHFCNIVSGGRQFSTMQYTNTIAAQSSSRSYTLLSLLFLWFQDNDLLQLSSTVGTHVCSHLIQPLQFHKDPSITSTGNRDGNPLLWSSLYCLFEALLLVVSHLLISSSFKSVFSTLTLDWGFAALCLTAVLKAYFFNVIFSNTYLN